MANILRLLRTTGFRQAAYFALAFALALGLLLSALYWTVSHQLRQQVQASIEAEMAALVATYTGEGPDNLYRELTEKSTVSPVSGGVYFLDDPSRGRSAGNVALTTRAVGWQTLPDGLIKANTPQDPDEDHRILGLGRRLPDGSYLFVGGDLFRLLAAQENILNAFGWAALGGVLLAGLAGLWLGRRLLNRIDVITATSHAIMSGNLRERIPTRGTSDELDRLSASLNEMLDRNQALMESLKHVSSNIAHDLRTPLSRLRQSLEASLAGTRDEAEFRSAVEEAMAEADSLLATFEGLLRIASIEARDRQAGFTAVSLSEVMTRVAEAYAPAIEDGGRSLAWTIAPGVTVAGDAELLTQMVANLVENAATHTQHGSHIVISLAPEGGRGFLATVSDDGPGIPPGEHRKVWERFYRLSASRSTPGSGLGLSLVAAVADLHRFAIILGDNHPGLRIELRGAVEEAMS